MSKVWKDSPKPLRPETTNPIFTEGEDTYVVKAQSAIEHQRTKDGTQHSMSRMSGLRPKGLDLFISEDKIKKSEPKAEKPKLDPDAVVKSFMESE